MKSPVGTVTLPRLGTETDAVRDIVEYAFPCSGLIDLQCICLDLAMLCTALGMIIERRTSSRDAHVYMIVNWKRSIWRHFGFGLYISP